MELSGQSCNTKCTFIQLALQKRATIFFQKIRFYFIAREACNFYSTRFRLKLEDLLKNSRKERLMYFDLTPHIKNTKSRESLYY
jgi:hypothetical protein